MDSFIADIQKTLQNYKKKSIYANLFLEMMNLSPRAWLNDANDGLDKNIGERKINDHKRGQIYNSRDKFTIKGTDNQYLHIPHYFVPQIFADIK